MAEVKRRVLLVAHDFPPQHSAGVELHTLGLARSLLAAGVETAVLYPAKAGEGALRIEAGGFEGLPVFRFHHPYDSCAFVFQQSGMEAAFAGLLEREGFDVVLFQHLQGFPSSFPAVARAAGCRVGMTLHDFWPICLMSHLIKRDDGRCAGPADMAECIRCIQPELDAASRQAQAGHPRNPIRLRLEAMAAALGQAGRLTVPSRHVLKTYQRHDLAAAAEVRPLGVDLVLRPRTAGGGTLRVLCPGNFHPLKNQLTLVVACLTVAGDMRLSLRGAVQDPAYHGQLAALAAVDPRIELGAAYGRGELPALLAEADLVVVPSLYESYSFTVREALAAGVPVFAAGVGGVPDAIEPGVNGMLFDPTDGDALAGLLARALAEPDWLGGLAASICPPRTLADEAADWAAWLAEETPAEVLGQPQALAQPVPVSATAPAPASLPMALAASCPRRLRVVLLSSEMPDYPCFLLRLWDPLSHWADRFELINGVSGYRQAGGDLSLDLDMDALGRADVVVVQRSFPRRATAQVLEAVLNAGLPVIYDTDDILHDLPAGHPAHGYSVNEGRTLLSFIRACDAVTVSTEALRQVYVPYNSYIHVLPNYLETAHWSGAGQGPHLPRRGRVVIGYVGGSTHLADLAMIEEALLALAAKHGDAIEFRFLGAVTPKLAELPNAIASATEIRYPEYPQMLAMLDLDIGLSPLVDTPFNRCKSPIKWLDYAALGICPVVSRVAPYVGHVRDGIDGVLVDARPEDWFAVLDRLVADAPRRRKIAQAARQRAWQDYSLDTRAALYAETYGHILTHTEPRPGPVHLDVGVDIDSQRETFYQVWLSTHGLPDWEAEAMADAAAAWPAPPRFHLGMIVLPGHEAGLAPSYESLALQVPGIPWRLSVVVDQVPEGVAIDGVAWLAAGDSALATLNQAFLASDADWLGLIEAGDRLPPHALFTLARHALAHPERQAWYTDEDLLDAEGNRQHPYFKPDLAVDWLRAAPFALGGLLLFHSAAYRDLGGLRPELEGVEQWDLSLRLLEMAGEGTIGHVADVLYHRHPEGGHSIRDADAVEAARLAAIQGHLERQGLAAGIADGLLPGSIRIRYRHATSPKVSIIIPTRDRADLLQRCLGSLLEFTDWPDYEVLVVDNGSSDPAALAMLDQVRAMDPARARVIDAPGPFNYAAMNNRAARQARGDYLLLLNNDTAVLEAGWLTEMMSYAQLPEVGAVGARLLYPDGRLQHAGVVLGLGTNVNHAFHGQAGTEDGYYGRLKLPMNFSAVTGACLLLRRDRYLDLGGLDEAAFPVSFNDLDLCLKLRRQGLRNVWTPYASLLHEGSVSQEGQVERLEDDARKRRFDAEERTFMQRWQGLLARDPAYNRNLSLSSTDFLVEFAPALTLDPDWRPRPRVLAHSADRMGCGEYRVISPMRAMTGAGRVQGWETSNYLSVPELLRFEPDVILLQRQVNDSQLAYTESYMRHSQAFRVYEIDDLITNVPIKNPRKAEFVKHTAEGLIKRFRKGIANCHRLVVSTDYLAEQYRGWTDEVVVLPNHLERARWGGLQPRRRGCRKPRVGWAGSPTHAGDLEIIADVVRHTVKEIDWVFFGMCPDKLCSLVAEFHPTVKLEDYAAKLASLDLDMAVAPLEDVPFNHAKSHLRLLECGVLGYPVICTDITPYRGDYPVTRVKNRYKDWLQAIRSHIADRDALAAAGDVLKAYVAQEWMLEDHLDRVAQAWLP